MKTSISTVSIAGDLREKLTAIAAAGFDGIEIFEQDFITFDGPPEEVGRLVRDYGLVIDLFQPLTDFEGFSGPSRSKAFDRAERKLDLMQQMGTNLLLVTSSDHPDSLGSIEKLAEDFRELGERAAKRGLRIGYEARAWGKLVSDYRDAWEVVRRADHPAVGLVLDSFHTLARNADLTPIRSIPGERIFHVQLADAPKIEMNLEYWSRHFRTMPGEGELNLLGFMSAVAATGYKGPLSLEILNDQFRSGSPRAIAVDGQRSLLNLMDKVRQQEPDLALDVPAMPARVPINGVSFVEFTASEKELGTLSNMLSTLGFVKAAQHIARDVALWRQGDINIVVNSSKEGFAHSAYVMHGMSVCDIGILVDDAQSAVERAKLLGASPFKQKRVAGELDIPAVRGVGGSVLHLLDQTSELAKVWEVEFNPVEGGNSHEGVGLTRIDHLAQVMTDEEMQTWTLFYESIFALDKTPMVDVSDPSGFVHSRAIQSADGAFRLTLNGARTHRTFAGRFIADSSGSSVQHLAFATNDLFATAKKLAEKGFTPLPMPENYYADLASRFELDAAFLAELKAANILYDEDENGGYLQLYSMPHGDGFFFELVERKGNYQSYGAPNAAYRTAAQKRLARPAGIPRK
ncbi:TIM barrel protein [uncultured Cohaesibacter sp.]|uniref:bifunctional sugar phosphate isomerase/epimerase/4-hydroxyphenylpyruvate dioxygenase family protein n=1 Tax=uncultured Cohaesibacter sp. TaxID=1002546 RepID=UPI0029C7F287|nr:TIM barrel protein [uncultured Cohaesibacter sp.]